METERNAGTIAPNLQDIGRRNGDRRPAAAILRIVIRNQHAERVIPPAQIKDDEVLPRAALRSREVRQKRRRRKADRERCHAAAYELASRDGHVRVSYTSW